MAATHFAIDLAASPRPRASLWGMALLVLALLATAWTGLHWQQHRARHVGEAETLARLQAALADRGAASRAALNRVPSPAERRVQADLSRLSADLFRPWFPLLDALEASAVPRVSLQQLSVDAAFTRLQLRVDAADLPEVLQYVQALDHAGAPLQGAQLIGHEWVVVAGESRRLSARIGAGLVGAAVATAVPVPGSAACGVDAAQPCLSAKATP